MQVRSENVALSHEISRLRVLLARGGGGMDMTSVTDGAAAARASIAIFPEPVGRRTVLVHPAYQEPQAVRGREYVSGDDHWSNVHKWTVPSDSPTSSKRLSPHDGSHPAALF